VTEGIAVRSRLLAGSAALAVAASGVGAQSVPRRDTVVAITHVAVVDVERGRVLPDRTVLVRDGRIDDVGPAEAVRVPPGARIVDGRSRWLIPGLWDMHTHTVGPSSEQLLPVYVAYGVTGVRDMGTDLDVLRRERERVRAGQAVGPRIVMAGPILDGPIGVAMPAAHRRWRIELTDPARARLVVDSIARAGADFIKVHERLSPAVYRAIADQARRARLPFAGHVPTAVGPRAAVDAGQGTVEHLVNVPLPCTRAESASLRARTPLEAIFGRCTSDDLAPLYRLFARSGLRHTPTLVVQQEIALRPEVQRVDPGERYVPLPVRAMMHEVGPFGGPVPPDYVRRRLRALFDKRVTQTGAMHRAGVPLLVGTDAPAVAPGWSVHEELRLLVRAGLGPADALRAATLEPARWLRATDSLGAVARGRRADLVLLDADPLADIGNTTRIRLVVADGRVYDRSALDTLLARAAR
jgi:imidazolonepropionase-like amidohydrolase